LLGALSPRLYDGQLTCGLARMGRLCIILPACRAHGAAINLIRPQWVCERSGLMAQQKRKMSRNEKIYYVISLLVVISMVVALVAVLFN
jgi:hypothetical protein